MNEAPNALWYYSREGEKLGPVSFEELRATAKNSGLNPRLDMAWTPGMNEWKASGEIEGLFERRSSVGETETLNPPSSPYAPPRHASVEVQMGEEGNWPGARRRSFIIATVFFPILFQMGTAIGLEFMTAQLGAEIMGVAMIGLMLVPFVVGIYFGINRLVNLGMSRWWYLGNFVPILNLWVAYRCFVCPAGYAYHKQLDGKGVFLAIVFWLMIALGLLLVAAVIALFTGMAESPHLREQIQEALRATSTSPAR
jgi:uncharacterized membrane protein YhaH (DUF805 family)